MSHIIPDIEAIGQQVSASPGKRIRLGALTRVRRSPWGSSFDGKSLDERSRTQEQR